MAEGKIKQQSNTYLTGSVSKSVAYRSTAVLTTISIPAGIWLVISYMVLGTAGTGTFNNTLGNVPVRSSEVNGGGSINARVVTGPINLDTVCYHNIANGCTVDNRWYAIKLL